MATRWNSAVEAEELRRSVFYKAGIGSVQPEKWICHARAQIEANGYHCAVTSEKGVGRGAVFFWVLYANPQLKQGGERVIGRRITHTVKLAVSYATQMNSVSFEKWLRQEIQQGWQGIATELAVREEIWARV